jgi:signal transduction histidine kinase
MVHEPLLRFSQDDTIHDLPLTALDHGSDEVIAQYEEQIESDAVILRGIAHDMNNLLLVIGGLGELLKTRDSDRQLIDTVADGLDEATRQMLSLSRTLGTLASRRPLSREAIDINDLLVRMEKTIAHLLGEGITLEMRHDASAGAIKAVRGELERVLLNLVLNAREAMGGTGKFQIATRTVRIDNVDHIRLTVTDTGCGMAPETARRAFDPQFTTKHNSEGRGHGLTTVRRIVRDCGGEILVVSEPGKGTTFEILLPRLPDPS